VSTALVQLAPTVREAFAAHASGRARADFVAQLIAISAKAPQTRARRRAEPEEAIAAYRALDRKPVSSGRVLSRSL
jgi:hypothetical protein